MRWTQLDRGTDVIAIRVRRSVSVVWFLTGAVAFALGWWLVGVVLSLALLGWAIVAGVWLWLRPASSPVVRDLAPWGLHRPGATRAASARRPPPASRRGS